jgi:hypothetical protein
MEHKAANPSRLTGDARQQLDDDPTRTGRIGTTRNGTNRFRILEADRIGRIVAGIVRKNGELRVAQRDMEVEGAVSEPRNLQMLESKVDPELRIDRHLALKTQLLTIEKSNTDTPFSLISIQDSQELV